MVILCKSCMNQWSSRNSIKGAEYTSHFESPVKLPSYTVSRQSGSPVCRVKGRSQGVDVEDLECVTSQESVQRGLGLLFDSRSVGRGPIRNDIEN